LFLNFTFEKGKFLANLFFFPKGYASFAMKKTYNVIIVPSILVEKGSFPNLNLIKSIQLDVIFQIDECKPGEIFNGDGLCVPCGRNKYSSIKLTGTLAFVRGL
jgi:hypothetical protein